MTLIVKLYVQVNSASYPQRDWKRSVSIRVRWWEPIVVLSAGCTTGPIVRWRGQWMAA